MHYYVGMRKKRAAEQLPAFLYDAKKINPFPVMAAPQLP